jgi:AcrR family transcriptional regulator
MSVQRKSETRKYELKRRAQQMEEMRGRIAAAAVELHTTVGPASTTISAIADRAGVQRHTVYRHFPDDASLFRACVTHGLATWPLPDPQRWRQVKDPRRRMRTALGELYAYFRRTEMAWSNILPDLRKLPELLEANAPVFAHWERMTEAILEGWPVHARHRTQVRALIALALDFATWQTLARRHELPDEAITRLFVDATGCFAAQCRS